MKRNRMCLTSVPAVLATCLLLGCTGAPAPVSAQNQPASAPPPGWVLTTPPGDAQNEFFVGSASDASGDAAKAEEQAVYSLIAEITRFMGVQVTAETSSDARASLDSFQAKVTQQVKQSSSARMAGFRVMDKFMDQRGARVTVYLLAQYERAELLKEKDAIARAFQEQIDAVEGPERQGRELEAQGDLFAALKSYIQAAAAASGSSIRNAEIKFERNINNAKVVLGRINLVKLNDRLKAEVGAAFPEPFRLKVVAGQLEKDPPVAGAEVIVSYKELRSGGRISIREQTLQSDGQGRIEFNHPAPSLVGNETISMYLNILPYLEPLQKAPRKLAEMSGVLEDLSAAKRVKFEFSVASAGKGYTMGVVVLDLNKSGKAVTPSGTASGISEGLSGDRYKLRSLTFNAVQLKDLDEGEAVALLTKAFAKQVDRIAFGVMTVDELENDSGSWVARAAGTIKVADLKSGELVYSKRLFKRSRGSSADAAAKAAFRSLGSDFGKDISRSMR